MGRLRAVVLVMTTAVVAAGCGDPQIDLEKRVIGRLTVDHHRLALADVDKSPHRIYVGPWSKNPEDVISARDSSHRVRTISNDFDYEPLLTFSTEADGQQCSIHVDRLRPGERVRSHWNLTDEEIRAVKDGTQEVIIVGSTCSGSL